MVTSNGYDAPDPVWQDNEVRFDVDRHGLALTKGEYAVDVLNRVEDTKGNNGMEGSLTITNLRLIWMSSTNPSINLTLGFHCVSNMSIHSSRSHLRGVTQSLVVVFVFKQIRYEFIFTHLHQTSPRLFSSVQTVHRAYETSKLYRTLTLRGGFVANKQVTLLPNEKQYSYYEGIWSLSSEQGQGSLGILVITSYRIVWFSVSTENFNVSVPYLQITHVDCHRSRFGEALVLDAKTATGKFTLGFRIDPDERRETIQREMVALATAFRQQPFFGIQYHVIEPEELKTVTTPRPVDVTRKVHHNPIDPLTRYMARAAAERDVVFDPRLGLSVEAPPEGYTTADLFDLGHQ